jgi:hypothetical protein
MPTHRAQAPAAGTLCARFLTTNAKNVIGSVRSGDAQRHALALRRHDRPLKRNRHLLMLNKTSDASVTIGYLPILARASHHETAKHDQSEQAA